MEFKRLLRMAISQLHSGRDPVFIALTRPQFIAGVNYGVFLTNVIFATDLFILFKSPLVFLFPIIIHLVFVRITHVEPRIFDILIARISHCCRVKNWAYWRCNSYRP